MNEKATRAQINIDWSASLPATAGFGYHEQFRVAAKCSETPRIRGVLDASC